MRCVHGGDFDAARGAGRLDDFGTAEVDRCEAGRLLHGSDAAAGFCAVAGWLATDVLNFPAEKRRHIADQISEEFFAAAISAVVECGSAETVSGVAQEPALSAAILRSPM